MTGRVHVGVDVYTVRTHDAKGNASVNVSSDTHLTSLLHTGDKDCGEEASSRKGQDRERRGWVVGGGGAMSRVKNVYALICM